MVYSHTCTYLPSMLYVCIRNELIVYFNVGNSFYDVPSIPYFSFYA